MRFSVRFEVWRDAELLLHDVLAPGVALTLGPGAAAVPTRALAEELKLLTPGSDGLGLRLAGALDGQVVVGGRTLRVRDGLLCDPRPEPLRLLDGDGGDLRLDDEGLHLRFAVCATRRFRRHGGLDYRLGTILAALTTAALAGVLVIANAPHSPRPGRTRYLAVRPAALDRALQRRPQPRPAAAPDAQGSANSVAAAPAVGAAHRAAAGVRRRGVAVASSQARAADRALRALGDLLSDPIGGGGASFTASAAASAGFDVAGLVGGLDAAGVRRAAARAPASLRRPTLQRALAHPARPGDARKPTQDEIARIVAAGSGRIQRCFERELLTSARASRGRIVVRWIVSAQGRARSLEVLRDSVSNAAIRGCVLDTVRSWRFPRWPGRTYAVVYPFDFFLSS